jgi:hypothetical protein
MLASTLLLLAQIPAPTPDPELTLGSSTFGSIVCAAGDQDFDGVPDLLVGEDGMQRLDCWVLSGKDGRMLGTFHRSPAHESWGRVFRAPDVDGDKRAEFGVLAFDFDDDERADLMLASVATGKDLWHVRVPRPDFGESFGLVRDGDGDGLEDIGLLRHLRATGGLELTILSSRTGAVIRTENLVGAKGSKTSAFREWRTREGEWRLAVLEQLDGAPPILSLFTESTGKPNWIVHAASKYSGEASLAMPGDVDGDGIPDLVASISDSVAVFSGKNGDLLHDIQRKDRDDSYTRFGDHLVVLGDLDGDGVADFAFTEVDAGFSGNIHAFSSRTGRKIWAVSAPEACYVSHFGMGLAAIGDLDGDGVPDLLAGTWNAPVQAPGWALLLSGRTGQPLRAFAREKDRVIASRVGKALPPYPNR